MRLRSVSRRRALMEIKSVVITQLFSFVPAIIPG